MHGRGPPARIGFRKRRPPSLLFISRGRPRSITARGLNYSPRPGLRAAAESCVGRARVPRPVAQRLTRRAIAERPPRPYRPSGKRHRRRFRGETAARERRGMSGRGRYARESRGVAPGLVRMHGALDRISSPRAPRGTMHPDERRLRENDGRARGNWRVSLFRRGLSASDYDSFSPGVAQRGRLQSVK